MTNSKIIWTKIDEAPALATEGLLPIVQAYTKGSGIGVETRDISLAGRIIANFPDKLTEEQKIPDYLQQLGDLAKTPEANIVKLPNISASIPQLQSAIKELQEKGYAIPDYPEEPKNDEEKALQVRFAKVLGSAVNPVLREGNSDRRAAASVKKFAQKNPHGMMKDWPKSGSQTRVAHMQEKDFFANEKSATMEKACDVRIEFAAGDEVSVLKEKVSLLEGEVIDTSVMNVAALRSFYAKEIQAAKESGGLLSLHLKATMMKISDPIMFGHCVSVYFEDVFSKHPGLLKEIGANLSNGFSDVLKKLDRLPADKKAQIEADIAAVYEKRPALAMVDSRKGITNLHVPNDVIIDASMPNVVRDGGKMWNRDDQLQDTVAMIPDRSYATMYQEIIADCQQHGQLDPSTMGSVSNVGLMAQKAEEYGSHDKTFEAPGNGTIRVVDIASGATVLEQGVETGDIFRMCQTKDAPIRDWVRLAVSRAKASGSPAIFWLDENRGHDAEIIKKVNQYLPDHDTAGLEIHIKKSEDAMKFSLERIRRGEDTISVTGNVLRDYLTDLFPILELGTSARMLSIVPLMQGGGLFETGAGGSAPKHVQQLIEEGHLRWDSLGEYCALVPSLELIAEKTQSKTAALFAETLDQAISTYLENGKSPSRKVNEIDNRGSTFCLALYWAQELANQDKDESVKARFAGVAKELSEKEAQITGELLAAQGSPVDLGGYFYTDPAKVIAAMRPSATLNAIIDSM